jgi:endonuclease I
MRRLFLLLWWPLAALAQPQLPQEALRFNPPALDLGPRHLAVVDTAVWLVNDHDGMVDLDGLAGLTGRVLALDLPGQLASGDSSLVVLRLDLRDDLDLEEALVLRAPAVGGLPQLALAAQPRHAHPDWTGAANLWGTALKSYLQTQVAGHTDLGYTGARQQMFGSIDNVDGQVQCVYTGTWVATTGIPDANIMNTEHTWPQSMGAEGTARSDLHHLFPTLNSPNSIRGNLPFGDVVTANWSQGGSLRGTDANGVTVFEPRDQHKGDGARALFYFALRYGNLSSFLTYQEPTLRAWALADTVSQKELERNDGIEAVQHNRNPFIDHMGWLARIASLAGSADPAPTRLLVLPTDSLWLAAAPGDTIWLDLPLLNAGNQTLLVGYLQSSSPADFSVVEAPAAIAAGRLGRTRLAFHPQAAGTQDLLLTISTNAQNGSLRQVAVGGTGTETALPLPPARPGGWRLAAIAPNPFNPTTQVTLELDRPAELALRLFDARGALVLERSDSLPAGRATLPLDLGGRPSGRYWLTVEDGARRETRPLTLLR